MAISLLGAVGFSKHCIFIHAAFYNTINILDYVVVYLQNFHYTVTAQ